MIQEIFKRIRAEGERPIWISLADEDIAIARAKAVDPYLPLAGVPFAVKDNFDVEGMPTTAGCPSFSYVPSRTATVVQRLFDAGAILIGKTNMDQFATGLVGTRSPFGACSSVYDARYISGGSSSGSAIAVAKSLCTFSLGTDTAGSGRVPAAFNNLIGLKPTRGLLSTSGVVPACRSLDCVSVFAKTVRDARAIWEVARGFDCDDPYSRTLPQGAGSAPWLSGSFRFGIPNEAQLKFFGDDDAPRLYQQAAERLKSIGGIRTTIDFTVFQEAAQLLYSGPWLAERFAAVGEFLSSARDVNEIVKNIILSGAKYSATDTFRSMYQLEALKQKAAEQWSCMDVLLLPTTGTTYTHDAISADPVRLNTNLGFYTNFVNLMDLAAIAVPAGFRPNGLPFGVSLTAPAFSDEALLSLAGQYLGEHDEERIAPGCVLLAVAGAHLTGQPLNHELTNRGGRLVKTCRTSGDYRLYALSNTKPAKPGLVREPKFNGWGIEVEVWAVPENTFGGFVAGIPAPLGIGTIQLEDGSFVKGFICEPAALSGAEEITRFGGWRSYVNDKIENCKL